MDLKIGTFRTNDGTKLHHEIATPDNPIGSIIFVHGLGDHIGRYKPFLRYFFEHGYKVCLYDQRGHGRSKGKRVDVENLKTYQEDLFAFYHHCRLLNGREIPWYLMGHSLGGLVVLNFLAQHRYLFKAAAVSSPSVEVGLAMPKKWKRGIGQLMVPFYPTMRIKGNVDSHWLSHDEKVVADYKTDRLIGHNITFRLGKAILENLHTVYTLPGRIYTPLMMVHGMEDKICDPRGTKKFFNALPLAEKRLKVYDGMYHELLNEVKKEEVYRDVEKWITSFH